MSKHVVTIENLSLSDVELRHVLAPYGVVEITQTPTRYSFDLIHLEEFVDGVDVAADSVEEAEQKALAYFKEMAADRPYEVYFGAQYQNHVTLHPDDIVPSLIEKSR